MFFTKTNNISENILALITFFHIFNYFFGILAKNWDYKIKKLLIALDIYCQIISKLTPSIPLALEEGVGFIITFINFVFYISLCSLRRYTEHMFH